MTLRECIDKIDAIDPNAYSDAQKAKWLLEADGSIASWVFLIAPSYVSRPDLMVDAGYAFPLLAPPPFDKLYPLYLHAMIHYANSEYERYQNDMQLYNEAYGEFWRWFAAEYEPALTTRVGSFAETYREADRLTLPACLCAGFTPVIGEDFDGNVSISVNGTQVVSVEDGTVTTANIALWLPVGGAITFDGAFSGTIGLSGKAYQYGWPDKYGRYA